MPSDPSTLAFTVRFVLAALATWRVSHLLAHEDGPADIILRLRRRLGEGWLGGLMDCFYCMSLWVAAPAALLATREPFLWIMTWLAVSGAACLLERLTAAPASTEAGTLLNEGGNDVLR